jgi:nucleotide-binding universal stress UspA family protein
VHHLLDGTMLKNLLVALDGSACAEHAFDLALLLAKAESSEITACSVADPRQTYGVGAPTMIENELLQIDLYARKIVDEALAKAREAGVSTTGAVLEGVPALEILRYAKEIGAGAIILGTHRRSGLKRLFMGSVAEGVLRASEIPVITVRMEATLAPLTAEAVL